MAMDRYELQIIDSQRDGKNFRITDTNGDNRIATSYDEDNANLIIDALNFYNKYHTAVEKGVIVAGIIVE